LSGASAPHSTSVDQSSTAPLSEVQLNQTSPLHATNLMHPEPSQPNVSIVRKSSNSFGCSLSFSLIGTR
ncbi:hypothetical protein, partial [Sphingorhabdus sp.]|uniref:hypothetical protein n=1 Tax=Sphingorhabdus sp. TaxID=1902408 RepID=UPI0037C55875